MVGSGRPDAIENITGLVLAGGLGRRMGGVAKGLQVFKGRPLLACVLERLQPQVGTLLINANQELPEHGRFGCPVVSDADADFAGPLAGMLAGLRACGSDWLLSVPCDSPFLPLDLGERLAATLLSSGAELAFPSCAGQAEPVFCLMHRRLADSAAEFLARGGRRLQQWQAAQNHVAVAFDRPGDPQAFLNINSLRELQEWQDHA